MLVHWWSYVAWRDGLGVVANPMRVIQGSSAFPQRWGCCGGGWGWIWLLFDGSSRSFWCPWLCMRCLRVPDACKAYSRMGLTIDLYVLCLTSLGPIITHAYIHIKTTHTLYTHTCTHRYKHIYINTNTHTTRTYKDIHRNTNTLRTDVYTHIII